MSGEFSDLQGTSLVKFQVGIGGQQLKSMSTSPSVASLAARNAADSNYAALRAFLFMTFGNDFELNSGAAGSGADWKMTFSRPSTGMTHALQFIFPGTDPTANQALTVASIVGDVITLQWTTVAAGTDKIVVDTTTYTSGTGATVAMFTKPINAEILWISNVIDTQFDGAPNASVGISGTPAKYGPTTAWDLTAPDKSRFTYHPNEPAIGSTEALILTFSAGGATVGAGHVLTAYVIPS